jgi:hypothetical protein
LRPKQTDLVPGKRQFRYVSTIRSAIVVRQRFFWIPATDTDIISTQHFWTGGLETAGPGCYDAVAIARAAGFRNAGYEPHPSCGDCPLTARSRPKRAVKIFRKIARAPPQWTFKHFDPLDTRRRAISPFPAPYR